MLWPRVERLQRPRGVCRARRLQMRRRVERVSGLQHRSVPGSILEQCCYCCRGRRRLRLRLRLPRAHERGCDGCCPQRCARFRVRRPAVCNTVSSPRAPQRSVVHAGAPDEHIGRRDPHGVRWRAAWRLRRRPQDVPLPARVRRPRVSIGLPAPSAASDSKQPATLIKHECVHSVRLGSRSRDARRGRSRRRHTDHRSTGVARSFVTGQINPDVARCDDSPTSARRLRTAGSCGRNRGGAARHAGVAGLRAGPQRARVLGGGTLHAQHHQRCRACSCSPPRPGPAAKPGGRRAGHQARPHAYRPAGVPRVPVPQQLQPPR